jgi:hypothetical protein
MSKGASMSRSTASPAVRTAPRAGSTLLALRVAAVLATLNVLYQAATAGQILMQSETAEEWHGGGAIALHVLTGLMTVAAFLHMRASRGPWWPTALSAVVFVATFVEASYGHGNTLGIHVPLALVLTIGTVWVTAWAFTRSATTPR